MCSNVNSREILRRQKKTRAGGKKEDCADGETKFSREAQAESRKNSNARGREKE